MTTTYSVIVLGTFLAFSPATAGGNQDRIPELQRQAPKDTTLTGCVARGAAAGTYMLTNAAREGEVAAQDATARVSVVLAGHDVDVSRHVDHRVSVTGAYLSESVALRAPGTEEKAGPAGAVLQADEKAARTFRVKSLAMLSTSCSQATD